MDAMQTYSTRNAARILQSTEARVRQWARLGGVEPQIGPGGRLEFTFQQLLLLRTTRGLLEAGIPARRVRRIWSSLRRQLTDDMPLTSIRILANGDRAVAWDGKTSWQPDSGQFLFDFEAGEIAQNAETGEGDEGIGFDVAEPEAEDSMEELELEESMAAKIEFAASGSRDARPRVIGEERLRAVQAGRTHGGARAASFNSDCSDMSETDTLTAEQWFHLGCELELESPVEALQAYLQAIAADPNLGDAHLNLGRLYHEAGELGKAEASYRDAVRCTPDDATCHFNLAVLYEDRGRPEEAILAYERAIACDPNAADCHYNLGLLLDGKGRRSDAMKHLMIARQLYGDSHPEH
jgi:Tfp pilus assembly protein PilF/DNA-binding transcriptional MerR regulator